MHALILLFDLEKETFHDQTITTRYPCSQNNYCRRSWIKGTYQEYIDDITIVNVQHLYEITI